MPDSALAPNRNLRAMAPSPADQLLGDLVAEVLMNELTAFPELPDAVSE